MGIGRSQARYMLEQSKYLKEHRYDALNMNGVAVLEDSQYRLKGSENFPNVFSVNNLYSNGAGDNLSFCFVKHLRDKKAREECQKNFYQSQQSASDIERQKLDLEAQALTQAAKSQWSAGQVALVSVIGIAALTGMVFVIKKFAK